LFLTIVVSTKKESPIRDGFIQTYRISCPRGFSKKVSAITNGGINISITELDDDMDEDKFSAMQAKFDRQAGE
jgi:hypothetical protein